MQMKITDKRLRDAQAAVEQGARRRVWDEKLSGFGAIVGRRFVSFVVQHRVNGKQELRTIGRLGAPDPDGKPWTEPRARAKARSWLGQMSEGVDPTAERRARRTDALTLRDALELHLADMRKMKRSPTTIRAYQTEIPKYLGALVDRPLTEIKGVDLAEVHERLTAEGKFHMANRLIAQVSAVWNTAERVHELPGKNPASRVRRNKLSPSRERVADEDLPEWLAKVEGLSPVRRDLQKFVLFTGLRSADARAIRWDDIDLKRAALHRPAPKGGEAKAFTLPLPATCVEALKRRKRENAIEFGQFGGDHGWVFPSLTQAKPYCVIHVAEPKERRVLKKGGPRVKILPGLHTLRRTYLSVAAEIGISDLDRHVLANHSYSSQNVNASYIGQSFEHLAERQRTIEAALWARLKPEAEADSDGR